MVGTGRTVATKRSPHSSSLDPSGVGTRGQSYKENI